jgi:hypothetical protein
MSAGSKAPSLGSAEAKSSSAQPTVGSVGTLNTENTGSPKIPHKGLSDSINNNSDKKQGDEKQGDDSNVESKSRDSAAEKLAFEDAVEVDADLESEECVFYKARLYPRSHLLPQNITPLNILHMFNLCYVP